jgi:hypothetical protein
MAHNEGNTARKGDVVEIVESRPLSRRKRWVVTRVVQRATRAGGAEQIEASATGEVPGA